MQTNLGHSGVGIKRSYEKQIGDGDVCKDSPCEIKQDKQVPYMSRFFCQLRMNVKTNRLISLWESASNSYGKPPQRLRLFRCLCSGTVNPQWATFNSYITGITVTFLFRSCSVYIPSISHECPMSIPYKSL